MVAKEILRLLHEKPRLTPMMIASELKIKDQHVRNVLVILSELNLVKNPVRGVYELSRRGKILIKSL